MILHTVNKSPFQDCSLNSCLRVAFPNSGILLIEDAVYAACELHNNLLTKEALAKHRVYALAPDLKARGLLDKVQPGIKLVDYDGFVELTEKFETVQSWY